MGVAVMAATLPPWGRHRRMPSARTLFVLAVALPLAALQEVSKPQAIFEASTRTDDDFFPCTRVPSAVRLPGSSVVLAFAEARRWVGDQCCPRACCGPDASEATCPVPRGQPRCSGGCHPWNASAAENHPGLSADDGGADRGTLGAAEIDSVDTTDRYICLRTSRDGGQSFGPLQPNITAMRSSNPSALVVGKRVLLFFNDARKNCSALIAAGADCGGVWMTESATGASWATPRKIFPARSEPCPRGRFCSVPAIVGPATSAALLPSGRIALALYTHFESSIGHPAVVGGVRTSMAASVVFSDDSGLTFTQSSTTLPFLGEPSLVHLPAVGKDALMLNARCADRKFYSKAAYPSPVSFCTAPSWRRGGPHTGASLLARSATRRGTAAAVTEAWP